MVLPQTEETHVGQEDGVDRHADLEAEINAGTIPATLSDRWPGYMWRAEVAFAIDLATGIGRELGVGLGRGYGAMGMFEIPGTADLVGRGPNGELVVVDRKSYDPNVPRAAINAQLHTLALAACRALGESTCDVAIWHEVRPLDVSIVEPWDLKTYSDDLFTLLESATRARAEFRKTGLVAAVPGNHCRWCGAFFNCPAQNALVTKFKAGVIGMSAEAMIPLATDEQAARAYELLADLKMLVKRVTGAVYARAAKDPIPLGNGRVFGTRPVKGDRVIDGNKAYEMIREKYGQKVADAAVTRQASQKQIVEAFEAAGIASPKPEKERLMKSLAAAGGVSQKDSTTIDEHDAPVAQLKVVNS